MKVFYITLVCFMMFMVEAKAQAPWPQSLLLTPEKTEFQKTSTHAEVMKFMEAIQLQSKHIYTFSMGKSLEGKDIPVAVLANPIVRTPEEAKVSGKTIVYIQGNIHAGEVEGKESVMMLMRDILLGDKKQLLDSLIIIFVPIYNTDANDKMAKGLRPSQEDSPLETGERETSEGYDLNRDGVKMEAKETRALFTQVINPWDPHIFVDLHTTNGTWHAYSLTWAPSFHSVGEYSLFDYSYHKMLPAITDSCNQKYNLMMGPYGDYSLEEGWPPKNFYSYNHHPRYLVNQFGFRNRMAILSEAFAHERFYQRIHSTYSFVAEILEYANTHSAEIRKITKDAEAATIANVLQNAGTAKKGTRFKMTPLNKLNNFITYDYIPFTDSLGKIKYHKSGKIVSYNNVDYHAKFVATSESNLPRGYIIPAEFSYIIQNLEMHGIKVEKLTSAKSYTGEEYIIDSLVHDKDIFQKHRMARLYGKFSPATHKFKKGDYMIDMAQPLSNLIFYLLEPESDDGLVQWNFFDLYIERMVGASERSGGERSGTTNQKKNFMVYPVFKYYK